MPRLWRLRLGVAVVVLTTLGCSVASAEVKVVRYHGYTVKVPVSWPVFRLSSDPTACVRFNRAAVYLGRPSAEQRCPAHAIGRPRAILIEPHHGIVRRPAEAALAASIPVPAADARTVTRASAASGVYTGLGFDVCSAPSPSQMGAWTASPYRAIGIYLGGTNLACSQPNLTAAWVSQESTAGWQLIPTYVGLQAPTNSCGCQPIKPGHAATEGAAAANDAIAQAQTLGLGAGSPVYYDMEAYPRNSTNSPAVETFLSAWTTQLHAAGYLSGVYSSADSGVRDLVAFQGPSFQEPDDIWIANWNGVESTADSNVPSTDWPSHQRLHQYAGGHNETYGKVRLDIDSDYLDGATAAGPVAPAAAPTLAVAPIATGSLQLHARWPGQTAVSSWQILASSNALALTPLSTPISGGPDTLLTVHSQFTYFAVEALDSSGQVLGTSTTAVTPPHLAIYGRSAFVPAHGLAGVPVGCFVATGCRITTTLTVGRTVIAQTGAVSVAGGSGRTVYFKLSPTGRKLLAAAPGRRLAVEATARSAGGPTASAPLDLVPFTTVGPAPARTLTQSPTLQIIAATAFTYRDSVGGILAGCFSTEPCAVSATLRYGSATIAQTGFEQLGVGQLGYLVFDLTPAGRSLLEHRRGNQLGVAVTLNDGAATASGRIVLVSYH